MSTNIQQSKVLFILKRREDYNDCYSYSYVGVSTGLYNSARFVSDMLNENSINSKLVVVTDNNDVDREVTNYQPTHVVIEALWIVPEKFEILTQLHPTVRWIIRMHSETPFIANEGIASKWLLEYTKYPNVTIACNAPRFLDEVRFLIEEKYGTKEGKKVNYLPNYYPVGHPITIPYDDFKDTIDVGCFGAIRPLKNQFLQAIAAIEFASWMNKKLRFHINVGRVEMKGDPILANLRELFAQLASTGNQLIEHQWTQHAEFIEIVRTMDIGLQVTFSETFNIVAADLASQGVPVVASKEVPWASGIFTADPTNSKDIVTKMERAWEWRRTNVWLNVRSLRRYCEETKKIWLRYFS